MSVTRKRVKQDVGETQMTSNGSGQSGNEEKWLERGHHPLLNDLILETLFGFVRRYDLKACRGVCKKWNFHTIPQMRSTFKVTIHGGKTNRRVDDFVQLFKSNELGIPFEKFKLGPFSTRDGAGRQFLQLCGETAKEIEFIQGSPPHVHEIENLAELLRACSNLKVLFLPNIDVLASRKIVKLFPDSAPMPTLSGLQRLTFLALNVRKGCPTFVEELLTATRNVSEIIVRDRYEEYSRESNTTSLVLDSIEELGMESSIESLSLHGVKGQNVQQVLRMGEKEKGLKLKSLTLEIHLWTLEERNACMELQLASVFRDTLQHLSLGKCMQTTFMDFPSIPNLKSFTLRNYPHSNSNVEERVDLNNKFPALETLDMDLEVDWQYWHSKDNGFSQFEPCLNLKGLKVDSLAISVRIDTFNNILRVFPNLIKITLNIHGDDGVGILRQIWSQMTGLKYLSISGGIPATDEMELDALFTGIPIQALQGLTQVIKELGKMNVDERRDKIKELQNEHRRLPSIQNLTNLAHLELGITGVEAETVSDLTAYLALYNLNHLRHLHVPSCRFSRICCQTLKTDIGLETWSIQNQNKRHIIPPFLLH